MGPIPAIGARLAKATFEPDIVLTDGVNKIIQGVSPYGVKSDETVVEGWMPFPWVFDTLWWGKRPDLAQRIDIKQATPAFNILRMQINLLDLDRRSRLRRDHTASGRTGHGIVIKRCHSGPF